MGLWRPKANRWEDREPRRVLRITFSAAYSASKHGGYTAIAPYVG